MSQSLSSILVHLIFSTKMREPWIDPVIMPDLHQYLAGTSHALHAHVYEVGGIEDHVHMLISLPRTMILCKLVEEIKKSSSKWIKTKGFALVK